MLFRSFAGAAALARSSSITRSSSSRIAQTLQTLRSPVQPLQTYLQQQRYNSHVTLEYLAPGNPNKKRRRIGRGRGSKRGGHTVGRGHNGQKARGKATPYVGFEGGQSPLYLRIPTRGFTNPNRKEYRPLRITKVQEWISQGRFDPNETLTINKAVSTNMVHGLTKRSYNGIKLTGTPRSDLPLPPLKVHLSRFSESASKAVLKAGGELSAVYHNRLALWQELHPDKFEDHRRVKVAGPTKRRDVEFYTNPENHGYLSDPEVKSAFFRERGWKTKAERRKLRRQAREKKKPVTV